MTKPTVHVPAIGEAEIPKDLREQWEIASLGEDDADSNVIERNLFSVIRSHIERIARLESELARIHATYDGAINAAITAAGYDPTGSKADAFRKTLREHVKGEHSEQ